MRVYIARQPVYSQQGTLFGYELLYRENVENEYRTDTDGNRATRAVMSNALTTFGMQNLTNGRPAFINFTGDLLLERYPLLLDPQEFIIEILENIQADGQLADRLRELRGKQYTIALDDYTGDSRFDGIMEYIDIVKVDFGLTNHYERAKIADRFRGTDVRLLAEKVETEGDYIEADCLGYSLYQGYYFARPTVFSKSSTDIMTSTYMRALQEISRATPDFDALTRIIRADINMTYKLLHRINTLQYYRSHRVKTVKHALVRMGLGEVRRWVMLVLMQDAVGRRYSEVVRTALVRGVFCELLAQHNGLARYAEDAYTAGMFSMIDVIVEETLPEVLEELYISDRVKEALLGEDNILHSILSFVKAYEMGEWDLARQSMEKYNVNMGKAADLYLQAIHYADVAFDETRLTPSGRSDHFL